MQINQPQRAPGFDANTIRLDLTQWTNGAVFAPVEMPVYGIPGSCRRFVLDGARDITRKDNAIRLDKALRITPVGAGPNQGGNPCALVTVILFATTTTIISTRHLPPGDHLLEIDVSHITTNAANPIRCRDLIMQHVVLQVIGTPRNGIEEHVMSTD